jgi:hypothetical protein
MGLHVADLDRRGVRPEHRPHVIGPTALTRDRRREIQRVLHVACGMLGGHVQGVETVPLVFDFGALDDRESHSREDRLHPVSDECQGMAAAHVRCATRKRDVNRPGRPFGRERACGVLGPSRFDGLLQLIREPADVLLLLGGHGGDQLHPRRRHAVLATEIPVAHGLRLPSGARRRQFGLERGDLSLDGG